MKVNWMEGFTFKMHTKILILCVSCTLIALVSQTVLFRETSSELIYEQAKTESLNSLQNMQDDVYSYIKEIETGMIQIYNEKNFMNSLKRDETIESLRDNYYRLAYNIATTNFDTQNYVLALYLYNDEHQIISTYRRATTPKHNYPEDIYEDEAQNNAEIIKKYVESDETIMLISSYYNPYRETDIFRFVLKIYNNSNTKQKSGYVVCDIDTKVLQYMMKKYIVSDDVFIWLQPVGDKPVYSIGNLSESAVESYDKLTKAVAIDGADLQDIFIGGNQVIFQVDQSKYNLVAYSVMPQSLLKQNQQQLTRNLLIIAGMMLVLVVFLSTFVSRTITRPLEELTLTSKRIKNGETVLRIKSIKKDEIGELGQSYNEMLDRIEDLVRNQYESKLLLNKAEYNALQAQINPHFLYNTLDTMSSIAHIKECEEVSALSQSLSSIFRYSLDMKNPISTISKEILHLKNYIYVMNVRMHDEIEYEFHIDDSVLGASIPRISIQPLVENAINHGLKNSHAGKKIWISVKYEEENLVISVTDNGVGMSREEVEHLLDNKETDETQKTTSIGLRNINERMKKLYGDTYGLRVESEIGKGTCATLLIPGIRAEEEKRWKQ